MKKLSTKNHSLLILGVILFVAGVLFDVLDIDFLEDIFKVGGALLVIIALLPQFLNRYKADED